MEIRMRFPNEYYQIRFKCLLSLFQGVHGSDKCTRLHYILSGTRQNYALGKPAHQSTTAWRFNGNASYAVDGDILTESHTDHEMFPFLVVELQQMIWVTGVALTSRNNDWCKTCAKLLQCVAIDQKTIFDLGYGVFYCHYDMSSPNVRPK